MEEKRSYKAYNEHDLIEHSRSSYYYSNNSLEQFSMMVKMCCWDKVHAKYFDSAEYNKRRGIALRNLCKIKQKQVQKLKNIKKIKHKRTAVWNQVQAIDSKLKNCLRKFSHDLLHAWKK